MKFSLIVLTLFFTQTSLGQTTCDKCDVSKVKKANEHLSALTLQIIADFLCTLDKICKNNVEFSEWSNETLFKIIDKSPKYFFKAITKRKINTELLLNEIENPIHYNIDLQNIYEKVNTTSAPTELKAKFLNALMVAFNKADICKLKGVWIVDKYRFADLSAMNDSMAIQWIGKKATINEHLEFEYSKITGYKNVFKEDNNCDFKIEKIINSVEPDKYFSENYRISSNLGVIQKNISILKTSCTGTPFEEILWLTPTQIIITWDGTFFFLTKER